MLRFCNNVNGTEPKLWLKLITASYRPQSLTARLAHKLEGNGKMKKRPSVFNVDNLHFRTNVKIYDINANKPKAAFCSVE
jgi:hypothetical protein